MNQPQTTSEWLDEFEVLDIIGNGMFGVIKKVKHRRSGEILARKELNFEKMTEKDRRQIVAEVNILKDLSHPHIVRYHDRHVDRENGYLYILMEYCGGGDLSRVLSKARKYKNPLPEDVIWKYFYQLLVALHHCHHPEAAPLGSSSPSTTPTPSITSGSSSPVDPTAPKRNQQILHRDIKPDNVFLTEDGILKLGDFGLSKQMGGAALTNTYVGTPYYMSPEMLNEKAYDSKSDIWSLGCLIYELCALAPPFYEAKTQQELTSMIRSGRIPPLPRGYSTLLSQTIKSMLNLHPGSRPSIVNLLATEKLLTVSRNEESQRLLDEIKEQKKVIEGRETQVSARESDIRKAQRQLEVDRTELQRAWTEYNRNIDMTKSDIIREREAIVEERRRLLAEKDAAVQEAQRLERERSQLLVDRDHVKAQLDSEMRAHASNLQTLDQKAMEFSQQFAAFQKEKQDFEKERETWRAERQESRKPKPFGEIHNERNTAPLPTRYLSHDDTPTKVAFPSTRRSQDQNVPPIPSLPSSRQQTPGSGRRLASKSNPNLGSAMKGVILTASGIAVDTPLNGTTHDIPPMPALPPLDLLSRMSLDSPGPVKVASTLSETDVSRSRSRRRSTISNGVRPAVTHATSLPTGIPVPVGSFNPATLPPSPVYDMADEANLPSPFIKKGSEGERRASSGWSMKGLARKTHGLLEAATSNAAAAKSSDPSSSTSTTTKPQRQSSMKAVRASGDALRALSRRV